MNIEPSNKESAESYLKKYKRLKEKKQAWLELFQFVGEFIDTKKVDFTSKSQHGSFLNKDLYDSTGPKANKKMAASLIGLMWQNGGKSIQLIPPESLKKPVKEETEYYKYITGKVQKAYDDPRAGFPLALEEYMQGQTCFGTSGILTDDGEKQGTLLKFKSLGVDGWCFGEGPNGTIVKAYGESKWSIENAAAEWGLDSLSPKSREKYNNGQCDDEISILHVIEPRLNLNPEKAGSDNMPIKSVLIEIDEKHIIKESGYNEMPAGIARIAKRTGEEYGRSPAMDALPDILVLNQVHEDYLVANEKKLEPPLGMYSDSLLGSNQVDTSARTITVFNPQGKVAGKGDPIWPLYAVGDVGGAMELIERLSQSINEHFMIDRLLDFNNQSQMTLGEAQMRMQIRGEGIVPLAMRQTFEGFIPWIERGVALLYRKGELGAVPGSNLDKEMRALGKEPQVIPERIAKLIAEGKDFYDIQFLTPAARLMQAEEATGITKTLEFAGQILQVYPQLRHSIDPDEALKRVAESFGSKGILRDEKSRDELVKQEQQQAQAAAQAQAQAAQAEIDKGQSEASIMGTEAQKAQEIME